MNNTLHFTRIYIVSSNIIYFRQVDPKKNKSLAESLSEQIHRENMRTVKVNAQVTAVISVFEIMGFVVISISCLIAQSALVGSILFPVLQNIVLPYAFLMNTRENKYRIVEHGWTNVLRNILNIEYLRCLKFKMDQQKNVI